jgi:hypothetical protein
VIPQELLQHLSPASRGHLRARVEQFTMQVLREGKATEESEHVGKGPPEVTAAHIDEAWWVMRRRVRRSRYPVLEVIVRVLQVPGASGIVPPGLARITEPDVSHFTTSCDSRWYLRGYNRAVGPMQ